MEVETLSDLPKVAVAAQREREELEARIAELTAAEEERRQLLEALEANQRERPNLDASVRALLTGTLSGATDPYQLAIAEKALVILSLRRDAAACEAMDLGTGDDLVQLTAAVARVVAMLHAARQVLPHREAAVEACRKRVVERVRSVCQHALVSVAWATEAFVKPLDWQQIGTCFGWLLTLEDGNVRETLHPFLEPLRRKFVFHFLEAPLTSRPDQFGQCCKWLLSALSLRSDFLISKVQHNAMVEFVRDMSSLLAIRAKRDFVLLLKETPVTAERNKVFLDSVDELFAWSDVVEQHYGYSLQDATLEHALLSALLPGQGPSVVSSHWLALERAAVEQHEGSALSELFVRAKRRLAVLPAAWHRREYFERVHAPLLQQLLSELSSSGDERLEELYSLGTTLTDWSMRPEFDQDNGMLARLADDCLDRVKATLTEHVREEGEEFLNALSPWLSKNWLYVSEAATAVLFSGNAHLDLSPELCGPYERLRDAMRSAERHLGPLFSRFALELAERIDEGLLELIVFEYSPPMSFELAKQLAFDLEMVFGLWCDVVKEEPWRLFKRTSDVLTILQMNANELTAVAAVNLMEEQHQRSFLSERFKIDNLSPRATKVCAELRKDRD